MHHVSRSSWTRPNQRRELPLEELVSLVQMSIHPLQRLDVLPRCGLLRALGAPGALIIVDQHYIDAILKKRAYFVTR